LLVLLVLLLSVLKKTLKPISRQLIENIWFLFLVPFLVSFLISFLVSFFESQARHVGHYAGVALTTKKRTQRLNEYMEKLAQGGLDHPEELMGEISHRVSPVPVKRAG